MLLEIFIILIAITFILIFLGFFDKMGLIAIVCAGLLLIVVGILILSSGLEIAAGINATTQEFNEEWNHSVVASSFWQSEDVRNCKIKNIALDGEQKTRNYRRFTLNFGDSMEPTLRVNDELWMMKLKPRDEVVVGDILMYPDIIYYLVHRVVRINYGYYNGEDYYYTKGDNNLHTDILPTNDQEIREGKVWRLWMATRNNEVVYCRS